MPNAPEIERFRRERARRLRQNATRAEDKLWHALRHLNLRGSHFRRQMPIGTYIADFACPAARIVTEIDGSQHGDKRASIYDQERTAWLNAIYTEVHGGLSAEARVLEHKRRCRRTAVHPTPPR
jgi:very-short-patch-repair endonuclease